MENLEQEQGVVAPKSAKDTWADNLRAKYPERDFSNEDELYSASMEGYDSEHDYRKKTTKENSELVELLTANPDVAAFIGSLINKESLPRAMSYLSDLMPLKGDDDWDEYNKGVEERRAAADKAEKAAEEYERNLEQSAETLREFADENSMSEEEAVEFVREITTKLTDKLFSGKIDKEFLQLFYNATNYDNDISDATEAGRIAGRNETIKAKRSKRKDDGLPNLGTSGGAVPATSNSDNATLNSLNRMIGNRDPRFMRK